ncbi:MAG: PadR family transcriptional regulator [Gammaproteobacteria bacterium]
MAKINKTKYAILGWLTKHDMSGYDLKKIVDKVSGQYWTESNAQLYPMLKELEILGYVESELDQSSGGRKRKIYRILQKGREKLVAWMKTPIDEGCFRDEFLLRLSFSNNIPVEEVIEHFNEHLVGLRRRFKCLQEIKKHIKEEFADRADQPYLLMLYRFREMDIDVRIKWCEDSIAQLEKMHVTSEKGTKRGK